MEYNLPIHKEKAVTFKCYDTNIGGYIEVTMLKKDYDDMDKTLKFYNQTCDIENDQKLK